MATGFFTMTTDATMAIFTGIDDAVARGQDDGGGTGAGRGDDGREAVARAPEDPLAAGEEIVQARQVQQQGGAQQEQDAEDGTGGEGVAIGDEASGVGIMDGIGGAGVTWVRAGKGAMVAQGKVKVGKADKQQASIAAEGAVGGQGARLTMCAFR